MKTGEWNEMAASLNGHRIVFHKNGVKTMELRNDTQGRLEGVIGLQAHGSKRLTEIGFKDLGVWHRTASWMHRGTQFKVLLEGFFIFPLQIQHVGLLLNTRRIRMNYLQVASRFILALLAVTVVPIVNAQVTIVEPGHTAGKLVDSVVPLDPSQTLLNTTAPTGGGIESIGQNVRTGTLYLQVQVPYGAYKSSTTHLFSLTPSGVVSVLKADTKFGINGRGTDLRWHPVSGLITQDQNAGAGRVVAVDPTSGVAATFATFSFTPAQGTFGVDVSTGVAGSDVPSGEILFTSDTAANGVYSSPLGGPVTQHFIPPVAGDDIVIQKSGAWVHVPDFSGIITAYNPAGPHPHLATPSPTGLNISGMFLGAGLPFVHGSRATTCRSTGEIYISYSGSPGGAGIFRVNAVLTTSTLLANIARPAGLQDLTIGPATTLGNSVYLTVNEQSTGTKQVWEISAPECPGGRVLIDIKPGSDPNSINTKSRGVIPVAVLGSSSFDVSWIDVTTVRFGPAGTPPVHSAYEDVNLDGYMDLVLHFEQQLTGLAEGDTQACVSGNLTISGPFMGCDAVRIVK